MKKVFLFLFLILSSFLAAKEYPIMMQLKTDLTISDDFRGGVEEGLTENGYSLVNEDDQKETLKEQANQRKQECFDESCLVDVGKMLAAKGLVIVEVVQKDEKSFSFKAKYIDFQSGTTQKTKTDYFEFELSNYKELNKFGKNLIKNMLGKTQTNERIIPTEKEAIEFVSKVGALKTDEKVLKTYIYEENNIYKIAILTNYFAYLLLENGKSYNLYFKSSRLINENMLDVFNGIEDIDSDGIKDFYYSKEEIKTQNKNINVISFKLKSFYTATGFNGSNDWEITTEFKFSANTPEKIKPWLQNKMFEFGFLKKPEEISLTDVNFAINVWYKQNKSLNMGDIDKKIIINEYSGDQNFMLSQKGLHPVIEILTIGDIEYKLHYKGVFAAYDKSSDKSYIIMPVRNLKNSGTTLFTDEKNIYIGLQNIGIIKYNYDKKTLTHIYPKELKNKDVFEITKEGKFLVITTDDKEPVKIPAN